MKKVRNNLWNKIFHSKTLKEYQKWKKTAESIIMWNSQLNVDLNKAKNLQDLIDIHKRAWQIGYRNPNITPLQWGMFRCESISELTLDNLYLGGIWGLLPNNGTFWENHKDGKFGQNDFGIDETLPIYKFIMQQYRQLLMSNINSIAKNTANELFCK